MNSFLYGMELFQIRMNTFQIGMYSLYVRYSHTCSGLVEFDKEMKEIKASKQFCFNFDEKMLSFEMR